MIKYIQILSLLGVTLIGCEISEIPAPFEIETQGEQLPEDAQEQINEQPLDAQPLSEEPSNTHGMPKTVAAIVAGTTLIALAASVGGYIYLKKRGLKNEHPLKDESDVDEVIPQEPKSESFEDTQENVQADHESQQISIGGESDSISSQEDKPVSQNPNISISSDSTDTMPSNNNQDPKNEPREEKQENNTKSYLDRTSEIINGMNIKMEKRFNLVVEKRQLESQIDLLNVSKRTNTTVGKSPEEDKERLEALEKRLNEVELELKNL